MAESEKNGRVWGGCLPILIGLGVLLVVVIGFVAWRMGGVEGFEQRVLVSGSVEATKEHILKNRPDGISESEIEALFASLDEAIDKGKVDLDRLYETIRRYQKTYKLPEKRPSNDELRAVLNELQKTILPEPATDDS